MNVPLTISFHSITPLFLFSNNPVKYGILNTQHNTHIFGYPRQIWLEFKKVPTNKYFRSNKKLKKYAIFVF